MSIFGRTPEEKAFVLETKRKQREAEDQEREKEKHAKNVFDKHAKEWDSYLVSFANGLFRKVKFSLKLWSRLENRTGHGDEMRTPDLRWEWSCRKPRINVIFYITEPETRFCLHFRIQEGFGSPGSATYCSLDVRSREELEAHSLEIFKALYNQGEKF